MSELTLTQATDQYIRSLVESRQQPEWLQEFRIKSLNLFRKLPAETSNLYTKYVDLAGVNFESMSLAPTEPSKSQIEAVMGKLKSDRALTIFQIESKTFPADIPEALRKEGVIFTDIGTAIRNEPEIFSRYFLEKAILPEEDKFAALNNALFTSGFYLHVPKGIEVTVPFRFVTILDSEGSGVFAQNLVMAENRSKFTILEEMYSTRLTAQSRKSTYSNLSDVYLHEGAEVTYGSINNLGQSDRETR